MAVIGGGRYRAIVASQCDGAVRFIRWMSEAEPEPSAAELAALAKSLRLGGSAYSRMLHEDEPANGGVPVVCRVVEYAWAGPQRSTLTNAQYEALAGLPIG
jgi:hypothetical protein